MDPRLRGDDGMCEQREDYLILRLSRVGGNPGGRAAIDGSRLRGTTDRVSIATTTSLFVIPA